MRFCLLYRHAGMFQIEEPDFLLFGQTKFWHLLVQHHKINFTGVATLQLDAAEQLNSVFSP